MAYMIFLGALRCFFKTLGLSNIPNVFLTIFLNNTLLKKL
jgi:hypothetical protein